MTTNKTESDAVVLTERIAASPEVVFDFLTDPEKMLRWIGTEVDVEPRPGGKFWLNANGTDIAIGTYVEVDPPNRVVFTWGWKDNPNVPPGSSTVTISLTSDGDETVVELHHGGLPGGAMDNHAAGWSRFLARLVEIAVGVDPG